MLRDASEQAAQSRIELTDEYLALIDRVEALPENHVGADKSWVARLRAWSTEHYAKATLRP